MADETDRLLRGDQHITLAFAEDRKEQLKCEAPESETDAPESETDAGAHYCIGETVSAYI